jgi:hypothetical protein
MVRMTIHSASALKDRMGTERGCCQLHSGKHGPLREAEIKRFWDLETIGIKAHQDVLWNANDSAIIQVFHDSFRVRGSRRRTLFFQVTDNA